MINVREVLHSHSYATTVRDLEAKGRAKVRVINAAEIANLIEQSVRQAFAKAEEGDGLKALVDKSKAEFSDLRKQRELDRVAREEGAKQLEQARTDLTQMRSQIEPLKTRIAELEKALESERSGKHGSSASGAAGSAPAGASSEVLERLAREVALLHDKMATQQQAPVQVQVPVAATLDTTALSSSLEKLSKGIEERLEKFGRSMGVSSAVEVGEVQYDKLFSSQQKLESNVSTVDIKERKGAGIGGVLDRMKKMRLGGGTPKPEEGSGDGAPKT